MNTLFTCQLQYVTANMSILQRVYQTTEVNSHVKHTTCTKSLQKYIIHTFAVFFFGLKVSERKRESLVEFQSIPDFKHISLQGKLRRVWCLHCNAQTLLASVESYKG